MGEGPYRAGGMTLVELLVVLGVVVVALSLGVPSLSRMVSSARMASATNTFFASLMLARTEAVKRKGRVVLCKSANGTACTSAGGWDQGWIVFHDANNNAAVDASEFIISREPALASEVRFTGNWFISNYVSYTPEGSTASTSGAFQSGTFTVCLKSPHPGEGRSIIIYKSGRPRISKTILPSCA